MTTQERIERIRKNDHPVWVKNCPGCFLLKAFDKARELAIDILCDGEKSVEEEFDRQLDEAMLAKDTHKGNDNDKR